MIRLDLMYRIITIGILLAGVILVLAMSPPAKASGRDEHDTQTINNVYIKKNNDGWRLPVVIIAVGAGVWCWLKCGDKKPDEPLPNPGPVPNDVTPDVQPNRIIFK